MMYLDNHFDTTTEPMLLYIDDCDHLATVPLPPFRTLVGKVGWLEENALSINLTKSQHVPGARCRQGLSFFADDVRVKLYNELRAQLGDVKPGNSIKITMYGSPSVKVTKVIDLTAFVENMAARLVAFDAQKSEP
jgi:hypothetical protein